MPALREIESSLAAAVLTGKPGSFPRHVAAMELGGERRLQIYRNHFTISLTECLAATFPVLKALVGESFFNQCARAFATDHPPSSPVLFEYGEAFPPYLFEATRSVDYAYFADVGAFEWAINHAYHADDAAEFDAVTILTVPDDRRGNMVFRFHPSIRLIVSEFPILDIWHANQPGVDSQAVDLSSGSIHLLVWRNGIDVVWRQLSKAEAIFANALLEGMTLAEACGRAISEDATFQPNAVLADLIGGNALSGFFLTTVPTER